jgi:segregation and condensation protein B
VLRLLLERNLIRIVGKKEEVGRPILYGTTKQFLEFFNLMDLKQLPTLKEFTELSEEMAAQLDPEDALTVGDGEEPTTTEPGVPAPGAAAAEMGAVRPAAWPGVIERSPMEEAISLAEAIATGQPLPEPSPQPEPSPTPEELAPTADEGGALGGPETWARPPTVAEEEEDAALEALDEALQRVDGIVKAQQEAERARLKALLQATADPGAAAPPPAATAKTTPASRAVVEAVAEDEPADVDDGEQAGA